MIVHDAATHQMTVEFKLILILHHFVKHSRNNLMDNQSSRRGHYIVSDEFVVSL